MAKYLHEAGGRTKAAQLRRAPAVQSEADEVPPTESGPTGLANPPANVSAEPASVTSELPAVVSPPPMLAADPAAMAPSIAASNLAPSACAPSIGLTASRATITIPSAPAASSVEQHPNSDEERTLLALLRLIDRLDGWGTLSTVERAFVAGAEIMFAQLSNECREMIKRKPSDLTRSMAAPDLPSHSAGNAFYSEPAPAKSATPGRAKAPKKSKSKPPADA